MYGNIHMLRVLEERHYVVVDEYPCQKETSAESVYFGPSVSPGDLFDHWLWFPVWFNALFGHLAYTQS